MLNALKAQRAAIKAELEALVAGAEGESRGLNDSESATFDVKVEEMRKLDARIAELTEAEVREAAAAAHRVETAAPAAPVAYGDGVRSEPNPVYRPDNMHERSFFKDLYTVSFNQKGVGEARTRLISAQETRAGDMTTSAAAGGTFAPPSWHIDEFVALARPGRVTADLMVHETLEPGVSSINLPKISGGSATGVQATQNSALTDTAMTTTSVSSGITLIAGRQIISRQLLDQSGIPFDRVILGDLAADYAKQLDAQVLSGTGANGQLRGLAGAAGSTVTYTTTQPGVVSSTAGASFYNQIVKAVYTVNTTRYMPPTAIIMHPVRWGWILQALDSQNRPLVVPSTPVYNGLGAGTGSLAQGAVGNLLGVNVYLDPNVSLTANSSTNQDEVFVIRTEDCWLYETPIETTSFEATYADNASVLFRAMAYSAFIPDRYSASIGHIVGTGLVTPTLG